MKKFGVLLVLLMICCATVGCGKKAKLTGLYPVKGKVTLNGEAVEGVMVTLVPENFTGDARSASGKTDANGVFKVQTMEPGDGAFPGNYGITITKRENDGPALSEEEFNAARDSGRQIISTSSNKFPPKYEKVGTSGLNVTVVAGKNPDLNLDL